jgi:hypothetical protein
VKKVTSKVIAKNHANSAKKPTMLPMTAHLNQQKNVSTASKKATCLMTVKTLQKKESDHHQCAGTAMRQAIWRLIAQSQDHAKCAAQLNISWLIAQTNSAIIAEEWVMEVLLVLNQPRYRSVSTAVEKVISRVIAKLHANSAKKPIMLHMTANKSLP